VIDDNTKYRYKDIKMKAINKHALLKKNTCRDMSTQSIHNIQITCPYTKSMKIQNTPQTTKLLLSISPFGNKAPKRKEKLVLGWRRRGPRARSGVVNCAAVSSSAEVDFCST
jgi:hypothetical protein